MSDIKNAIKQLCEEKSLDYDSVLAAIELALAAAYRKDYGERNQNIRVDFDPATGKSEIFDVKTVVDNLPAEEEAEMLKNLYNPDPKELRKEEFNRENQIKEKEDDENIGEERKRFNPKTDIQLKEAMILKHDAKVGDEIVTDLPIPESYGRMAAQTAKQVIVQKLREMERDMIFGEFKNKEQEVVSGIVQRKEGRFVFVDLGKAIGLMPAEEQIYNERYNIGDRLKIFIKEVREGHKGPEIILSRRSEEILRKVFYLEIPEIANGTVEIKSIAREAGSRSKVAIYTESDNVDPVGSCVGQRGSRIQTIISELGGEKIDIIEYDEDPAKFIANSLAPAKVISITLDEEERKAQVKVSSDKLSLAIGKNGQNVRLAARLTGWKIDIIESGEDGEKVIVSENDVQPEEKLETGLETESEVEASKSQDE
ncbi:MAG: transcription termination factor NusA [Patescibacteria group bacterium]|nr:transcription termination factor NusA [Patescibacteria group bacterium]MDD3939202.1 transcription termination factor NusA [Patescibacteria group bacterium]MDD4443492.1 transcription termination factor NusA [Patescibacteria group bacterium]NCU39592.1 transcription termination/antitermination protein NusA [Candidatus Falkowbacteria bacterium]